MDVSKDLVPAVPPLWLHVGTERPLLSPRWLKRGKAKTDLYHFEWKIHPNYLTWRHVTLNHVTIACCLAVERTLSSPPSCPRRVSGAPITMAPGGPRQCAPGLLFVRMRDAVARNISSTRRRRDASPREPTSHVALRATTPPSSLRLKGRTSVPEKASIGGEISNI